MKRPKRTADERLALRRETDRRNMAKFRERHSSAHVALTPPQEAKLRAECERTGATRSEVLRRLIDALPEPLTRSRSPKKGADARSTSAPKPKNNRKKHD